MSHEDASPPNPPPTLPADSIDRSAESVMAEYLQRVEDGQPVDAADYLCRYPQHAAELESFFRNRDWLSGRVRNDEPTNAAGDWTGAADLVGKSVGCYVIEAEIARGGMGVVYRARQQGLGRVVALKLINSGVLAGSEQRTRFRHEAEAAARLQHPGIVPIHETGTWEGHEYFSMALVDGPTLQAWVDSAAEKSACLDYDCLAATVRDIGRAVAHAHRHGIVHRDLKPENILLDGDRRPLVADFGLAKWHGEGTVVTRTGQVLGTPSYMSPEQAAGSCDGGPAVDVYAMGAILYALLTGHPPHQGPSVAEVLRSVLQDEPISPRHHRADVPVGLEAVCRKAMQFQPEHRYATADDLAEDLDRYLNGEELEASHSGLVDLVTRQIQRDQHQETFKWWGRTLTWIGVVIFCIHVVIFGLSSFDLPFWTTYWVPRLTMLATIFELVRRSRGGYLLPRTAAERPIWSIWMGYLATLATINGILFLGGIDESTLFPIAAALSGFGFLAMSGHIWGGASLLGFGFLIIAIVTQLLPTTAPLWFGGMWLAAMTVLGRRYRITRNPQNP